MKRLRWRNVKDFEHTLQKRVTKKRRASDAERKKEKKKRKDVCVCVCMCVLRRGIMQSMKAMLKFDVLD